MMTPLPPQPVLTAAPRRRVLRRVRTPLLVSGIFALAAAAACGAGGFDSQSKVDSVRIFGVKADKPYAKSGEIVTLEVLATDGRADKPRPMKIFWIPVVCVNPRQDLYYLCFLPSRTADGQPIDGGTRLEPPFPPDGGVASADAGALGGGLSSIPTGIDLSPFLPQGPTFTFRMPDSVVLDRPGSPRYGLTIIFNIACAGQVRLAERTGSGPQQIPIQCTDEEGTPLGPKDFVIGINRVYSYDDRTNTNPVIEKLTLDGGVVDPDKGITIDHCVAERRGDCPPVKFGVTVSPSSWELNPSIEGAADQHEQIWVTYYSNLGDLRDEARLLYDPTRGLVTESDVEYRAPYTAADGTLWAVVHDNRAGAAFVVVPLHVR